MDPALANEVAMLARTRVIDEAIHRGDSEVQNFYKDTTLLISGGTGFMGKQLLEKLFRSCDVKKVFLLMRAKKKKEFHERLEEMLKDPVFDSVKKSRPGFEKKIIPIQGDVAELQLGITEADRATIIAETDIIIHAAATINFDEPLEVAVRTNTRGTVEMLKLGKECKKLKSYVHVSTAYSYATKSRFNQEVSEQFYDPPLSPQLAIDIADSMDVNRLHSITPDLIKNWPNTYTFTKAIAEEACRDAASDLPICIVRPAIVIASNLEPSPGWLDKSCIFGPSGFIFGTGIGVMHTVQCELNCCIDVVPVDYVNNAIIASAWLTAKQRSEGKTETTIYNVTSARNPILWRNMLDIFISQVRNQYLSPVSVYYVFLIATRYKLIYLLLSWLWHSIPAYIADSVLLILGKKTRCVKLCKKMDKHSEVFSYFTTNEWLFKDHNLQRLYASLNTTDKQIYNCNIGPMNWKDMFVSWSLGIRKYIVKDGLQGTETALKKQFWFRILHYTVVAPLYFYLLYKTAALAFKLVLYTISILLSILVFFLRLDSR